MRRSCRTFALLAAIAAAVQFLGASQVNAQEEVTLIDFNQPDWDYLFTNVDEGGNLNAVDPTVDTTFVSSVGAGGIPIWAFPSYDPSVFTVNGQFLTSGVPQTLTWQNGTAPFHYGNVNAIAAGTGTVLATPADQQRYTQYFRKDFTTTASYEQVLITGVVDDSFVAYIDGIEVARYNCCQGSNVGDVPGYTELSNAVGQEDNDIAPVILDLSGLPGGNLAAGAHTIAFENHQQANTSSDMGLNIRLYAVEGDNQLAVDAEGSWTSSGNWTLFVPNNPGDEALMANGATTPTTLYQNGGMTVGALTIDNAAKYVLAGLGTFTFDNVDANASLDVVQGSHEFQMAVSLTTALDVDVAAGATLEFNNDVLTNGQTLTKTGAGTMAINNYIDGDVVMAAGAAMGSGAVGGNLNNDGAVLSPGAGVGVMNVDGDYTQGADGALAIEIAGEGIGQFDVLQVLGVMNIDGAMQVSLIDGFDPAVGATFDILDFGQINGEFDVLDLPQLSSGKYWDASNLYASGSLSVVPEPGAFLMAGLAAVMFGFARRRR